MPTRYTVVCDDDLAREIQQLAHENSLTEEEVLHQLLDLALDSMETERAGSV
ncbi:MAG: CopG family transcriptional regulator [Halapricum sp.]